VCGARETRTFQRGIDWLRSLNIEVLNLGSQECATLLADYIQKNPALWQEDFGDDYSCDLHKS
jgi:cytosine/creatinine deaminase